MKFKNRYSRNMMTLCPEENARLHTFKVCVIGCGGLGGYVIEFLARIGIGYITAVDGDVFDETNLNRQILSSESHIGKSKAMTAQERIKDVNSDVEINPRHEFLTEETCDAIICGHDVVIDALDNMTVRLILERHCETLNIPLIHGAIAGWFGQVATIFPGDRTLEKIYPKGENKGAESELGNPSFTPAFVASLQAAEAVKLLLGKGGLLKNRLLSIDVLNHEYEVFHI